MNRKIIVAVVVISGSGLVNAMLNGTALTPVVLGSYIFLFVLAILDMYGGPVSTLAGALAMLAATYIVITELPWQKILTLVQGLNPQPTPTGCPAGWVKVPSSRNSSGFVCTKAGADSCPPGYNAIMVNGVLSACSPTGSV